MQGPRIQSLFQNGNQAASQIKVGRAEEAKQGRPQQAQLQQPAQKKIVEVEFPECSICLETMKIYDGQ